MPELIGTTKNFSCLRASVPISFRNKRKPNSMLCRVIFKTGILCAIKTGMLGAIKTGLWFRRPGSGGGRWVGRWDRVRNAGRRCRRRVAGNG